MVRHFAASRRRVLDIFVYLQPRKRVHCLVAAHAVKCRSSPSAVGANSAPIP